MKLLYGTGNLAKLSAMRNRLEQLDIELIGLPQNWTYPLIQPKLIEKYMQIEKQAWRCEVFYI